MKHILTTLELREILSRFPDDSIPVIHECGPGHYYPIILGEQDFIESAYFPENFSKSELENSGWKFNGDGELESEPLFVEIGMV